MPNTNSSPDTPDAMVGRIAVTTVICRYMTLLDRRRWQELEALFAPQVYYDYTSLRPEPPAQWMERSTMLAMWRDRHEAMISHQHHMSNIVADVNGDRATCSASGIATHCRRRPDGNSYLWQMGGYYDFGLIHSDGQWLIETVRMTRHWQSGPVL
jgi:hypothetical protein